MKNLPGVSWNDPQGAFYVFLSAQSLLPARAGKRKIIDSVALAGYLLEEWNLATVPGIGFGREGYVRISFANSLDNLKAAFDRLELGLAGLVPG